MDWSIKVCIITATTKLCEGIYTPCSLSDDVLRNKLMQSSIQPKTILPVHVYVHMSQRADGRGIYPQACACMHKEAKGNIHL